MNAFDALVLVLLALAAIAGARAGFLSPLIGTGGAIRMAFALLAASLLHEPLAQVEQPTRALITLLGLGALVLAGEATGAAIGATGRGIRSSPLRPLDMAGGAIVGAAHVVLLVWLVGGLLATSFSPIFGPAARDSVAVRITGERLPPPGAVAGRIMELLATTDLRGSSPGSSHRRPTPSTFRPTRRSARWRTPRSPAPRRSRAPGAARVCLSAAASSSGRSTQ